MNQRGLPAQGSAEGEKSSGVAAATLAMIVFSWGSVLVKTVGLPPAALACYRLAIGASFIAVVAWIRGSRWPRRGWPMLAGAALSFGLHQLLFVTASQQTSIAIVTLIAALQPLVVALIGHRAVGERMSPPLVGFALIALLGIALVVHANLNDGSRSARGDLFAALNMLCFTSYFLFSKRALMAGANTLTFTASVLGLALIVVMPAMLFTGVALPDTRQSLTLLLLALGPGNGHLLLNWAHPRVSATLSSLILSGIPLLATVWAHLVFAEPLGWRHVVGIGLVALAIEAARRSEQREAGPEPDSIARK